MFNCVGSIPLFVSRQDRPKDFYARIPGFELRRDVCIHPGAANRWVSVVCNESRSGSGGTAPGIK
jgi:hypothetical protein